jgi:predicted nucleotidyltransferase
MTQKLQNEVKQLAERIATHYSPEKIILFGSMARGTEGPGSDIDLLIIKRTDKQPQGRIREVIDLLPHEIDVDILVLTPEEVSARQVENNYLLEEILSEGMVLFEKK